MSPKQKGYTIVEVLLVIAITGVLFVMVILSSRGQQAKVQFKDDMIAVQGKIEDVFDSVNKGYIVNDVGTGAQVTCSTKTGPPVLGTGDPDGTCTFYGRDISFCPAPSATALTATYLIDTRYISGDVAYQAYAMKDLNQPFTLPGVVQFTSAIPADFCHAAALYNATNDNIQNAPRYYATNPAVGSNPDWKSITTDLKWCFTDGARKAQIIITQTAVTLEMEPVGC